MIALRPLMDLHVTVAPPQIVVGDGPLGRRRIALVGGRSFSGERLSGQVVGGADWVLERHDGVLELDARLILRTKDEAFITMSFRGFRHGPPEVLARIMAGSPVGPHEYYQRAAPFFETGAPAYAWLNRIVSVASAERRPDEIVYRVFEVL